MTIPAGASHFRRRSRDHARLGYPLRPREGLRHGFVAARAVARSRPRSAGDGRRAPVPPPRSPRALRPKWCNRARGAAGLTFSEAELERHRPAPSSSASCSWRRARRRTTTLLVRPPRVARALASAWSTPASRRRKAARRSRRRPRWSRRSVRSRAGSIPRTTRGSARRSAQRNARPRPISPGSTPAPSAP